MSSFFTNVAKCTSLKRIQRKNHHATMSVDCRPLTPHFYIEKLGLTGVIHYFLFFALNIDCGYLLKRFIQAVLTCTHNLCFEQN